VLLFEPLLVLVCQQNGLTEEMLTGSGRQKDWIQARRLLVYLGREWANLTTQDLRRRFQRDPSMISLLYKEYEENRDLRREALVVWALNSTLPS
jgi:chromosomal replication initiation ATPase DnaA